MRKKLIVVPYFAEMIADILIANGVTIPVQCKDCKHGFPFQMGYSCAFNGHIGVRDDDFCSYGERQDTE